MTRHAGSGVQEGSSLQLTCEQVLGITSKSNAAFASHPSSGLLAYAAGCVIVIVDVRSSSQIGRIINPAKKEIVSLAFSNDGKYIASGESGHKPSVRVWELASGQLFAHFDGHDNAIPFVMFSPNEKYLVSIGNQFDNTINLWNWRKRERLSSTKNTAMIHAATFPDSDSRHFLTVGKGHCKFWYIEEEKGSQLYLKGVVPSGSIARKLFSGAAYTDGSHVTAAYGGNLCQFAVETAAQSQTSSKKGGKDKEKRDKWVLRTPDKNHQAGVKHIASLVADPARQIVFAGCENGIIKVLNAGDLSEAEPCQLPKPHRLDDLLGNGEGQAVNGADEDFNMQADVTALSLVGNLLVAFYSDHSLYVWNTADLNKVTKESSFLFHSCRILGLDAYPTVDMPLLPPNSFVTCSNDGTIRVWKADFDSPSQSFELLHAIYCADLVEIHNKKQEPDGSGVATCVTFNPNGQEIAAGFRDGSVRIYDLSNLRSKPKLAKPAEQVPAGHSASVLALEYSRLGVPGVQLLAASGCDGFIWLFNVANGYSFQQHLRSLQSSAINGLRFAKAKNDPSQIWLVSSSQDKSIRFHGAHISVGAKMDSPDYLGKFDDGRQVVLPCSPHDIEVNEQHALIIASCHDRMIRLYDFQSSSCNNEALSSYQGAGTNDGTLKRHSIDSSGAMLATICSDKTISLACRPWDLKKNRTSHDRVVATASGHSEQMSGVKFLANSPRFVTVASDSCALVWKSPPVEALERKVAATMSRQSSATSDCSSVAKSPTMEPKAAKPSRASSSSSRKSKNSSTASSPQTSPAVDSKPLEDAPVEAKKAQKRKLDDQVDNAPQAKLNNEIEEELPERKAEDDSPAEPETGKKDLSLTWEDFIGEGSESSSLAPEDPMKEDLADEPSSEPQVQTEVQPKVLSYAAVASKGQQQATTPEVPPPVAPPTLTDDEQDIVAIEESIAEISLGQTAVDRSPKAKPTRLEIKSTAATSPVRITTPEEVDVVAMELQEMSQRLFHELHLPPTPGSGDSVKRRIIQAIFQVRRELDECLESAMFSDNLNDEKN